MATKIEFTVSDEMHEKFLRKYQEVLQAREDDKEGGGKITLSDAAKKIFDTGVPRIMATTKYALRKAGKLAPYTKPAKKAKPAPKPKKARPVKEMAKPKGARGRPSGVALHRAVLAALARKQASKAKAPRVRKAKAPAPVAASTPAATHVAEAKAEAAAPVLD